MIEILILGFVIGMGHALEADHLAAVSTISAREQRLDRIIRHGLSWGFGHALALFIIAGAAIWFQANLGQRLADGLEVAVGIMLMILGARVLWHLVRDRIHIHQHRHNDGTHHLHAHSHRYDGRDHGPSSHAHDHPSRLSTGALAIGLVHGMAGSAALIVLAAAGLATPALGLAYVALFGLGSVLGMGLLSVVIAAPLAWAARSLTLVNQAIQLGIGLGAIGIGSLTVLERLPMLIGA